MNCKPPNRIAAEDISGLVTWSPPEVGNGNKVVAAAEKKKEQRERHQRDSEIIEDVEDNEVSYSPMTAEELQAITEAAEKEGLEKGYQEGFAKGEADGRRIAREKAELEASEQLGTQVNNLLQVAEALLQPILGQEQALENTLLDFVVGLTRQVVERELQMDSSQVLAAVQIAMQALPAGATNIQVSVNPDDLALIETYAEEQQKDWAFRSDPGLMPGGCRIQSRDSLVDFSMEHRLDELLTQFRNKQLADNTETAAVPDPEPESEPGLEQVESPVADHDNGAVATAEPAAGLENSFGQQS